MKHAPYAFIHQLFAVKISVAILLGATGFSVANASPVAVLQDTNFNWGFNLYPSVNGCNTPSICGNDVNGSRIPNVILWSAKNPSAIQPVWNIADWGSLGSLTDNYGLPIRTVNCTANDGSCIANAYVRDMRAAPAANNSYINYPTLYANDSQLRPSLLFAHQDASGIPLDSNGHVPVDVVRSTCPGASKPYVRCLPDGTTQTSFGVGRKNGTIINESQNYLGGTIVDPLFNSSIQGTPGLDTTTNPQPLIYSSLIMPASGGSVTFKTNAFNEYYMRDIFGKSVLNSGGSGFDLNNFINGFYDGTTTTNKSVSSPSMLYFHDGDGNSSNDIYGDTAMVANWENLVGQGGRASGQAGWRHTYVNQDVHSGPGNGPYPVAGLKKLNFHMNHSVTENRYTPCDLTEISDPDSNSDGCAKDAGWGFINLEFGFYDPQAGYQWIYLRISGHEATSSAMDQWEGCTYKNWSDDNGDGVFDVGDSIPNNIAPNANHFEQSGVNWWRQIYEMSDVVLGTDASAGIPSAQLPRYWACSEPRIPMYKANKALRAVIPHIGEPYATAAQTGLIEQPLVEQVHWAGSYPPSLNPADKLPGTIFPNTYPMLSNSYQWAFDQGGVRHTIMQPANQYSAYTLNPNPSLGTSYETKNQYDAPSTVFSNLLTPNNWSPSSASHITSQSGSVEYQFNVLPYLIQSVNAINQSAVADLILNHGCGSVVSGGNPTQPICAYTPLKVEDFVFAGFLISDQETANLSVYTTTYSGLSLSAVKTHQDFTGDGNADIIVRDVGSDLYQGQWRHYAVVNNVAASPNPFIGSSDMDIQYIATMDANGDGTDDILVRSISTGIWYFYPVNNGDKTAVIQLSLPSTANWQFASAGDFNGDGIDDILLRCVDSVACGGNYGRYNIYYIDNATVNDSLTQNVGWSSASMSIVPVGAGDLNGDGVEELLTQDITTGSFYATNPISGVTTSLTDIVNNSDNAFQAIADINQDGIADILLRSKSTGAWKLYTFTNMMKPTLSSPYTLNIPNNLAFKFAYVGDYSGDGINDIAILEPNGSTNDIYVSTIQIDSQRNPSVSSTNYLLTLQTGFTPLVIDSNADGIPNYWALQNGQNPFGASIANTLAPNGFTFLYDYQNGLNPVALNGDTDVDGLTDTYEINTSHTNPLLVDTDNDGMPDGWEVQYGLNPLVNDAALDKDGDIMPNLWEYQQGFNPNNAADGTMDADGDGLYNQTEYQASTNPHITDTDYDGLNDWREVVVRDTAGIVIDPSNHLDPPMVFVEKNYIAAVDDTGYPTSANANLDLWNAQDGSTIWWNAALGNKTIAGLVTTTVGGSSVDCGLYATGPDCYSSITMLHGIKLVGNLDHACALDAGDATHPSAAYCFGDGDTYQQVSGKPSLASPKDVAVGLYHSCALDSTGVKCWGKNSGAGQANAVPTFTSTPIAIAAGDAHTCAIISAAPYVKCWGDNSKNQLSPLPTGLSSPWQIVAGSNHTCVINGDYTVKCWGANNVYQSQVPSSLGVAGASNTVVRLSASGDETCSSKVTAAHTISSAVRCWPLNVDINNSGTLADSDGDGLSDYDEITSTTGGVHITNPQSTDTDGDGTSDFADTTPSDTDGDGVDNNVDNCQLKANTLQLNLDYPLDNFGNACDVDVSNDGKTNGSNGVINSYDLLWAAKQTGKVIVINIGGLSITAPVVGKTSEFKQKDFYTAANPYVPGP